MMNEVVCLEDVKTKALGAMTISPPVYDKVLIAHKKV